MKVTKGAQNIRVAATGEGPGCTVGVHQANGDPGGWVISLYARFATQDYLVARVVLAARAGSFDADRVVLTAACPGAVDFFAVVDSPNPPPANGIMVDVFCGPSTGSGPTAVLP